jgi:hypothetical protein
MAKHVFLMTEDQFKNIVKGKEKELATILRVEEGEAIEFAYGCMRQGWMSKMYHKDKQQKDQAITRMIKERMKEDPELLERLQKHDERKGATARK